MLNRLPRPAYWALVGVMFVVMIWAMHGQG